MSVAANSNQGLASTGGVSRPPYAPLQPSAVQQQQQQQQQQTTGIGNISLNAGSPVHLAFPSHMSNSNNDVGSSPPSLSAVDHQASSSAGLSSSDISSWAGVLSNGWPQQPDLHVDQVLRHPPAPVVHDANLLRPREITSLRGYASDAAELTQFVNMLHVVDGKALEEQSTAEMQFFDTILQRYSETYVFGSRTFLDLTRVLCKYRLDRGEFMDNAKLPHVIRVLQLLRFLCRDEKQLRRLIRSGGAVKQLVGLLCTTTKESFQAASASADMVNAILVELCCIFKAFATWYPKIFLQLRVHTVLVDLLSTTDSALLDHVLECLLAINERQTLNESFSRRRFMEPALDILRQPGYGLCHRIKVLQLLPTALLHPGLRAECQMGGGNQLFMGFLTCDSTDLVLGSLYCLGIMAQDEFSVKEIRNSGAVPLLLELLSHGHPEPSPELARVATWLLTQLCVDDDVTIQIRRQSGVPILGQLVCHESKDLNHYSMKLFALRTLRYVFSVERNRESIRPCFPTEIFSLFVNLGNYVSDLSQYVPIVNLLQDLTRTERNGVIYRFEQLRSQQQRRVRNYIILEKLGEGAFGTVYQVQQEGTDLMFALKELLIKDGRVASNINADEIGVDAETYCKEVDILRKMDHPNIVKFETAFSEGNYLYIVMELVEGKSLAEYLSSLQNKSSRLPEGMIWSIFLQLALALGYMHLEKHVVHRDLHPSNVMIDDMRRVKITDFGLARERLQNQSQMKSAVGTVTYSCPEIIKHQPYTDKADIWSLGCILYQLATLKPPFAGNNALIVAESIVHARYDPIPPEYGYSPLLASTVARILTVDPKSRPNIIVVSQMVAPLLTVELEKSKQVQMLLERDLAQERMMLRRTQEELARYKYVYTQMVQTRNIGHTLFSPNNGGSDQGSPVYAQESPAGGFHFSRVSVTSNSLFEPDDKSNTTALDAVSEINVPPPQQSRSNQPSALSTRSTSAAGGAVSAQPQSSTSVGDTHLLDAMWRKVEYVSQIAPLRGARETCRGCVVRLVHMLTSSSPAIHVKATLSKLLAGSPEPLPVDLGVSLQEFESGYQFSNGVAGQSANRITFAAIRQFIDLICREAGVEFDGVPSLAASQQQQQQQQSQMQPLHFPLVPSTSTGSIVSTSSYGGRDPLAQANSHAQVHAHAERLERRARASSRDATQQFVEAVRQQSLPLETAQSQSHAQPHPPPQGQGHSSYAYSAGSPHHQPNPATHPHLRNFTPAMDPVQSSPPHNALSQHQAPQHQQQQHVVPAISAQEQQYQFHAPSAMTLARSSSHPRNMSITSNGSSVLPAASPPGGAGLQPMLPPHLSLNTASGMLVTGAVSGLSKTLDSNDGAGGPGQGSFNSSNAAPGGGGAMTAAMKSAHALRAYYAGDTSIPSSLTAPSNGTAPSISPSGHGGVAGASGAAGIGRPAGTPSTPQMSGMAAPGMPAAARYGSGSPRVTLGSMAQSHGTATAYTYGFGYGDTDALQHEPLSAALSYADTPHSGSARAPESPSPAAFAFPRSGSRPSAVNTYAGGSGAATGSMAAYGPGSARLVGARRPQTRGGVGTPQPRNGGDQN